MNPILDKAGRSQARLAAVQALYQMELTGGKSKLVVNEFNDHWFNQSSDNPATENTSSNNPQDIDRDYFELIVLGVVAEQEKVDEAISAKLNEKWKLKRLDTTLRALMRCAAYEILRNFDVPATVLIDEYVSIAADFYDGGEPGFVNASLENLVREHRGAKT